MKPPSGARDPRRAIVIGVAGLLAAGLIARTLAGPDPWTGWRVNRALARTRAGDPVTARVELQALLEEHPDRPDGWFRVGRALREAGRANEATLYLTKAVERDSTSSLFRYELAKSLAGAGLTEDALRVIGDLVRLDPEHADGLYLGAALEASRGDLVATILLFDRAQRAGPSDPDRYRWDPLFDPVRNDPAFLRIAYLWRAGSPFPPGEDEES
jgi:tetratricopeptide (TPR) repeat protein